MAVFDPPPQNPHPHRSPKNVAGDYVGGPTAVPKLVQIRPWEPYGWNITNVLNLFIYTFFSGTRLQVRSIDGFSCLTAQTTQTRARAFRWHCSLFFLLMKNFYCSSPMNSQNDLVYPPDIMTQHNIHASHISSLLRHRKQHGDRSVSKIQEGCFNAEDTGNNFWQLLWHWLPEIQAYG